MPYVFVCFFFFFKQKTAYEMRISDWSSDVCSSDLRGGRVRHHRVVLGERGGDPRLAPARRTCRHARARSRALVWPFRDPGGEGRARLRLGRRRRPSRRLMLFLPPRSPSWPVAAAPARTPVPGTPPPAPRPRTPPT